jgi:hypothetical protein
MSKFAMRLTTLVICAASLSLNPLMTSAHAETSSGKHIKKHKKVARHSTGFRQSWSAGPAWTVVPSGEVCPGLGRSFDCKIWPPPFSEDPDRRNPGRL